MILLCFNAISDATKEVRSLTMTPNIRKPVTQHQAGFEATLDLVERSQEEHNLTAHDFDRLRFAFEDDGHRGKS